MKHESKQEKIAHRPLYEGKDYSTGRGEMHDFHGQEQRDDDAAHETPEMEAREPALEMPVKFHGAPPSGAHPSRYGVTEHSAASVAIAGSNEKGQPGGGQEPYKSFDDVPKE